MNRRYVLSFLTAGAFAVICCVISGLAYKNFEYYKPRYNSSQICAVGYDGINETCTVCYTNSWEWSNPSPHCFSYPFTGEATLKYWAYDNGYLLAFYVTRGEYCANTRDDAIAAAFHAWQGCYPMVYDISDPTIWSWELPHVTAFWICIGVTGGSALFFCLLGVLDLIGKCSSKTYELISVNNDITFEK